MSYNLLFKTLIFYFLSIVPSYAYLDPGTGSIIVQALVVGYIFLRTQISLFFKKISFFNLDIKLSSLKKIFLSLIVLIIPILDFLNTNYLQVDKVVIFQCLIVFIINILIFLILLIIFKIFKSPNYLIIPIIIWLLFQNLNLKNLIGSNYDGEIAIMITISLIFIVYWLNQKYLNIFSNIAFLFFFGYFLISLPLFIYKYNSLNKSILSKKTDQNLIINNIDFVEKKPNIYFFLMDSMTSLNRFNEQFPEQINYDLLKKEFENLELNYIQNTTGIFNATYLNFASLMNNGIVVDEKSDKYSTRKIFFPHIKKSKLIKVINDNNYTFKWIGNSWADCYHLIKSCISYSDESDSLNFFKFVIRNSLNHQTFYKFYFSTPFAGIVTNINKILKTNNYVHQWEYKANDAIGDFLNNVKIDKNKSINYFYLVHSFMPRWPYVFDENCKKRDDDSHLDNNFLGYAKSYNCALKRIKEVSSFIIKKDKDAIIIFTTDVGMNFSNKQYFDLTKKEYLEYMKTFTLVKISEHCKNHLDSNVDMINLVSIALECRTNKNFKIKPNNTYMGFYENYEKFGKILLIN